MIDLHVHSVYSDGTDSPAELIQLATARSLSAMALTDHDTVGGIAPLLEAAASSPVEPVPGIELSADAVTVPCISLDISSIIRVQRFAGKSNGSNPGREYRNVEILKKLNKLGYVLLWSDVEKQAGCDVIGRPHFAEALVARGHVKTRKAAFDLLLAKGRPAYADRDRYTAGECIDLIRQAGGVSVLAHPATIYLPEDELKELVKGMKEQGLGGIEVYYAEHKPQNFKKFRGWAEEFDLICTGGTDYHGANSPDLKLGTGFGQLRVPDEALDQLKTAAGKT